MLAAASATASEAAAPAEIGRARDREPRVWHRHRRVPRRPHDVGRVHCFASQVLPRR